MIVFWPHDKFPPCLSGKITEEFENGSVSVHGYGTIVAPKVILTDAAGNDVRNRLQELASRRSVELDEIYSRYKAEMLEIAPFLGEGWRK